MDKNNLNSIPKTFFNLILAKIYAFVNSFSKKYISILDV